MRLLNPINRPTKCIINQEDTKCILDVNSKPNSFFFMLRTNMRRFSYFPFLPPLSDHFTSIQCDLIKPLETKFHMSSWEYSKSMMTASSIFQLAI